MQRTLKIQLQDNQDLIQTIRVYSDIYQKICDIGLREKTWNKIELHSLTYKQIRHAYPNFPSALVQTARDVASETLKRTKLKKRIKTKPHSSVRLDKRNLRVDLRHNSISISSIAGRLKINFKTNPLVNKYKTWSVAAGRLSFKNGKLFLNLVVEKLKPRQVQFTENDVLGIDRGIKNILVCSNNQFFNAKHLKKVKGRYQYLKKILQSKGTPSAKRKLKKIAESERRFVTDVNHRLSKAIANSDFKVFILEDLKRMTNKKNGKKFNKKLGSWSFKQFEMFLKYKTDELGKLVLNVNPKHTSQKCSLCGYIKRANRHSSNFKCKNCGFELNSDLNAARNIANFGKSEVSRLLFNQPNVTVNEAEESADTSYKPTHILVGS